jgi:hypothetical protein
MYKQVVRVAVNNNFNCTPAEFDQLDLLSELHTESFFFVNSNIKTPDILAINDHPYQAVITLNPDIVVMDNLVQRLYDISSKRIAFVRIKYVPGFTSIPDLIKTISRKYQVVITMQRFNSKRTISQFVPNYKEHYKFSCSRFRLNDTEAIDHLMNTSKKVHICDRSGLGCQGCGLCSTLTVKENMPIFSLNLSASGICPYSCVDCYARAMQDKLRKWGKPVIHYDWIHRNHKQQGRTEHIKRMRAAA